MPTHKEPCSMSVTNMNSVPTEYVTTLTVHFLIDGKRDPSRCFFQNVDIAKGVLIGETHV